MRALPRTPRGRLLLLGALVALAAGGEVWRRAETYGRQSAQRTQREVDRATAAIDRADRCIEGVLAVIAEVTGQVADELGRAPFDPATYAARLRYAVEEEAPAALAGLGCVDAGGALLATDQIVHGMGLALLPAFAERWPAADRPEAAIDCAPPRPDRYGLMYGRGEDEAADGSLRALCGAEADLAAAGGRGDLAAALITGRLWTEPHAAQRTGAWVADHAAVMRDAAGRPVGVLFSQIALQSYARLLTLLDFGASGYGFLVSGAGQFIAHPSDTMAMRDATIWDLDEPILRALAGPRPPPGGLLRCAEGGDFVSKAVDGQTFRAALRPVAEADWCLGAVLLSNDRHSPDAVDQRRARLAIAFWVMLAASGLLLVFAAARWPWSRGRDEILVVIGVSALLLAGGVYVLQQELAGSPLRVPPDDTPTGEQAVLAASGIGDALRAADRLEHMPLLTEAAALARFDGARTPPRARVPTGVFVQSLNFTDTNDVAVTGYVWQRFERPVLTDGPSEPPPADCPQQAADGACIAPGFVFPEAIDADVTDAWNRTREGRTARGARQWITERGWSFEATLRQPFHYEQYPFDGKDVWLRLWPTAFYDNVALVPDLAGYDFTAPALMPGLDDELLVPGWDLEASFFSYHTRDYDTRFVAGGVVAQPELFFHVLLRRNFTNALVTNFGPLLVVVLMLFGLVLSISRSEDREGLMAFNFNGFLGTSASFFFVVIVAHIQLREKLSSQLVYLEYFFLMMYVVLFVCSALAYVVALDEAALAQALEARRLQKHDPRGLRLAIWLNSRRGYHAFKLLYWPTLMSVWFVLTVKAFY